VLALALCSLLLGFVPWHAYLPVSPNALPNPLTLGALSSALWPILLGGVVAILVGRWDPRFAGLPGVAVALVEPVRHTALVLVRCIVQVDGALRQWPAASLALLAVAIMFGAAMLAGR
jgi:multicomponent Na+:H+ antiporter subunit D